jgi:hypothetical protein
MARIKEALYVDNSRLEGALKYNTIRVLDANVHEYANDPTNHERTGGQQLGFSGILQSNFVYNVNAEWQEKLANINIPVLGAVGTKVARAVTGDTSRTGIFTEKFYQGASYLVISPKFRVVDWNGDGNVIQTAVKVINKLLPMGNNKTVSELVNENPDYTKSLTKAISNASTAAAKAVLDGVIDFGADASAYTSNTLRGIVDTVVKTSNRFLWGEPEPVRVQIGNFFDMNNMVLETASVEFSKEMTKYGPLYADFDVQFTSKMALVKHATGLIPMDGKGNRVRIKGTFAEDRAYRAKENERIKDFHDSYTQPKIQESLLLYTLKKDYGYDPVNDFVNNVYEKIGAR